MEDIKIGTRVAVNHNKALLVSSKYTTCFGRADHSQAFKYVTLNPQNKIYIYILDAGPSGRAV